MLLKADVLLQLVITNITVTIASNMYITDVVSCLKAWNTRLSAPALYYSNSFASFRVDFGLRKDNVLIALLWRYVNPGPELLSNSHFASYMMIHHFELGSVAFTAMVDTEIFVILMHRDFRCCSILFSRLCYVIYDFPRNHLFQCPTSFFVRSVCATSTLKTIQRVAAHSLLLYASPRKCDVYSFNI